MIAEEQACLNFVQDYFQGSIALDNGCGTGHIADFIAQSGANHVIGIDISEEAILEANLHYQKPNLEFCTMNCLALGLSSEKFDFVSSLEVIEHLEFTEQYLSELHRVLKQGGWAYLSTPNKAISSPGLDKPSWPFHVREFYLDDFRAILNVVFDEVEVWGVRIPIYESHSIRKVTNSPLARIKHVLPPKLRLIIGAFLRYRIKPALEAEDVIFTKTNIEAAHRFVALAHKVLET
jgi:2-polyprenyl-3-methyl-5-hydroxy-6-metoxy-1,4-benzoquinol methylase